MPFAFRRCRGFTLIELLMVLCIISILAFAGVSMIGDRKGNAVRTVMDEIEGVLQNAQMNATVSSTDIPLVTYGRWVDTANPLTLDGRRITGSYPANAGDACNGRVTPRVGATSEIFTAHYLSDRDHMSAAIVSDPSWITTALGLAPALINVSPGKDEPFVSALGNPLFKKDAPYQNLIRINGVTKRFETGFYIAIVGISGGQPVPNSAVGILVVPKNSSTVYKFYKSSSSTNWTRI